MTTPAGAGTATGQTSTDTGDGQQNSQAGQGDGSNGATGDGQGSGEGQATGDGGQASGGRTPAEEVAHWKAMARKNEARARENSKAAAKLQELEDKDKTELQRANDRAAKAERDAQEATAERHRLLAAAKHGLGPDLVEYLGTGSEEDIFTRAENLSKVIDGQVTARLTAELQKYGIQFNSDGSGQPNGTAPSAGAAASLALGRRPAESMRPGASPATDRQPQDANAAFRSMLGR